MWPAMTAPAQAPQDHANVVIYVPVLLLATTALGVILDWFLPIDILSKLPGAPRLVAGAALLLLGLFVVIRVNKVFNAAGTSIRPDRPTNALVTAGLFAHSRNPVYVGGTIMLIGVALLLASDWIVVLAVPMLLIQHYGVVKREELYLERKFGEPYRSYKASVPRYGWKF
jgi:protein-S-isoprenylcysteine O-methyltransferase Ste14